MRLVGERERERERRGGETREMMTRVFSKCEGEGGRRERERERRSEDENKSIVFVLPPLPSSTHANYCHSAARARLLPPPRRSLLRSSSSSSYWSSPRVVGVCVGVVGTDVRWRRHNIWASGVLNDSNSHPSTTHLRHLSNERSGTNNWSRHACVVFSFLASDGGKNGDVANIPIIRHRITVVVRIFIAFAEI